MVICSIAKKDVCPGVSVKRPRYTANSIFLISSLLLGFLTSAAAGCRCAALEKRYARGFLTLRERDDYCFSGCDFLGTSCERSTSILSGYSFDFGKASGFVGDLVTNVISGEYDDISSSMLNPEVNEATIDAWWELFGRSWGVFLCAVPVLLNQYKYYNIIGASVLTILFIALCMFDIMPRTVAYHNILIAMVSLLHSSNSSMLIESVWTSILVVVPVFALFIVDPMWHLCMLVSVMIGFAAYLRWCFFCKRSGFNAGVVVVISQVFMIAEQMWFVKNAMGLKTLGGAAIEAVLGTVIPDGASVSYASNASDKSVSIAKLVPFNINPIPTYLIALFIQICFFLFFRASLGAYYLHILRYKTDIRSLSAGFFVYSADFFGPVKCLLCLIFGYEKVNIRRVGYFVVGIVLMVSECFYAREFAVYRVVMSLFDISVLQSRYGRMTHYLSVDVDFMQAAFPHDGAPPWTSMDVLVRLADYTSILISKDGSDKSGRGLGVMLNSAGATLLYSVRHVVANTTLVSFRDVQYSTPDFRKVTNGSDPLMAQKVGFDSEAPEVELLTKSEAFDVLQLVFINCSTDDERYICFVPEFKLRAGELQANVNLRKGDSGGPCFAMLASGVIRLCGVVSRGVPRGGGGNIISFCYSNEEIGADSADDDSMGPASQFGAVKRVKFASDTDMRESAAISFRGYLKEHASYIEDMKPWLTHFKWEDLEKEEWSVCDRICSADYTRLNNLEKRPGGDDDGPDSDYPPDESRKKGTKDAKSRRKDKAYRKRQLDMSIILGEKLKQVYSTQDAKTIFENIARGYVPRLNSRQYIVSGDRDNWVISDSLPDSDWT